jgi:hypothetical protein
MLNVRARLNDLVTPHHIIADVDVIGIDVYAAR